MQVQLLGGLFVHGVRQEWRIAVSQYSSYVLYILYRTITW
jgi:hypothetical protein